MVFGLEKFGKGDRWFSIGEDVVIEEYQCLKRLQKSSNTEIQAAGDFLKPSAE